MSTPTVVNDMNRFVIVELPASATHEERQQIAKRIAVALESPTHEPPAARLSENPRTLRFELGRAMDKIGDLEERLRTSQPPSPDASIRIGDSVRVGPNARGEYGGVMTVTKIMYVLNHGAAMVPDDCVVRATATKPDEQA